jgi:hypothetical protein
MCRRSYLSINAMAVLGLALLPGSAVGQQKSLTEQLVGTWTLVSNCEVFQDGKKNCDAFGPTTKGLLMLAPNGWFSLQVIGGGRPKVPGIVNTRMPVGPAVAYFGKYSVSEGEKAITYHVQSAAHPNFEGTDRKVSVTVSADDLSIVSVLIQSPQGPFRPHQEWKRAK